MKKILLGITLVSLFACSEQIKKESDVKEPKGAEVEDTTNVANEEVETEEVVEELPSEESPIIGFYVGYFEADREKNKDYQEMWIDDGWGWNMNNKINISIDRIWEGKVYGHSVVAGNDRPFEGPITVTETGGTKTYTVKAKEPGDDKYDGEFEFVVTKDKMKGKWTAYKNLKIKHRVYELEPKEYKYNPEIMLEYSKPYLNWTKKMDEVETYGEGDEVEEWVYTQYGSATEKIYEINASTTRLTKKDVENLKKGDLTIIRNTIYARHGYSFKFKPLRIFFDQQEWYIPVHTDIKAEFTDIEKDNIKLLMKYEKNAAEYYDSFGRG